MFVLTNTGQCSFEVRSEADDLDLNTFSGNPTLNATSSNSTAARN
jgi:hypothetical protein